MKPDSRLEKARAARREYMKSYRLRPGNKEKEAERQMRYWLRKATESEKKGGATDG